MSIFKKIFKKKEEETKPKVKPAKVAIEKTNKVKPVQSVKVISRKSEEKAEKAQPTKKVVKKTDVKAYKILKRPVITEKVTDLTMFNKYTFVVPMKATKSEVKKTVINLYGVEPLKVNMIKVSGKKVRYGRRFGRTSDWKKAIVTLAATDKIEIYEGV